MTVKSRYLKVDFFKEINIISLNTSAYSKRDQLSLNYVMWKNHIVITPFYEPYENHRKNGDFEFIYGKNHTHDVVKKGRYERFIYLDMKFSVLK